MVSCMLWSGALNSVDGRCCCATRYLKYLTKKFLKKHNVRDWLRVIASNKDRRRAKPIACRRVLAGMAPAVAAFFVT